MVLALVRLIAEPTPERAAEARRRAQSGDMDAALDVLAEQRLVSTLGRLLLHDPELELPEQVAQRIRAVQLRARQRGLLNHGVTARLALALGDIGIAAVPLKGAVLADAVYGDIGARQSSDIDLLVARADLDRAVEAAERQGWREPELLKAGGLPRLHRELFHDSLPPLELHWRVHWYEESYADSALARAQPAEDGLLRLQPADELVCLLLVLARDGLSGLRQTVDVAAWWAALGDADTGAAVRAITAEHPQLERAIATAASHAEDLAGIPRGALAGAGELSRRQRAALRLANPWLTGSRQQIDAEVSLVDGLLAPPHGTRSFLGRQLFPSRWALVKRQPKLRRASRARIGAVRLGRAVRVLSRYALTTRALMGPRRT
jgi:hypothetical protein